MYIITAEHRHNRDMGFVCLPSLSLSYLDINTCTGTQCSPPPTPSSFHYLSRTHPRYNYNPLNPRYSPRERILLRPLQRPLNPEHHWLMPHFSFWAWPLPFIGTLDSALSRISFVEASTPWSKKIDKVVWRGTAWFNSVGNTNLRPKLLEVTKGKEWADVEDLKWYNNGEKARNSIDIEDFCKYKYIIYTEVFSLPSLPPFSSPKGRKLILSDEGNNLLRPPPFPLILPLHPPHPTALLPNAHNAPAPPIVLLVPPSPRNYLKPTLPELPVAEILLPFSANIVFIPPNWSDLEAIVAWLRAHPEIAEGIAERQREVVRKGVFERGE
jgi:hypothetical protein